METCTRSMGFCLSRSCFNHRAVRLLQHRSTSLSFASQAQPIQSMHHLCRNSGRVALTLPPLTTRPPSTMSSCVHVFRTTSRARPFHHSLHKRALPGPNQLAPTTHPNHSHPVWFRGTMPTTTGQPPNGSRGRIETIKHFLQQSWEVLRYGVSRGRMENIKDFLQRNWEALWYPVMFIIAVPIVGIFVPWLFANGDERRLREARARWQRGKGSSTTSSPARNEEAEK